MGILAFIFFVPVAILIICIIISFSSESSRKHGKYQPRSYYAGYDDDTSGGFGNDTAEPDFSNRADSDEFYGGIPIGDSTLYLTDDDDFIEEFGDDVL